MGSTFSWSILRYIYSVCRLFDSITIEYGALNPPCAEGAPLPLWDAGAEIQDRVNQKLSARQWTEPKKTKKNGIPSYQHTGTGPCKRMAGEPRTGGPARTTRNTCTSFHPGGFLSITKDHAVPLQQVNHLCKKRKCRKERAIGRDGDARRRRLRRGVRRAGPSVRATESRGRLQDS